MSNPIDARTALALAMRDARQSSAINLELADLALRALERNNWRLVGPDHDHDVVADNGYFLCPVCGVAVQT